MTAPTSAQLLSFVNSSFQQQGSGGTAFFMALCDAISKGWSTWEAGLVFGALSVTGVGVGAWLGSGVGGVMQGAPFQIPPFVFMAQDPRQAKLVDGYRQTLPTAMTAWATSFKFISLQYIGVSTATPVTPGVVTATCTPMPLATAGKGTDPTSASMAAAWEALLTPPDFDLTAPMGKTKDLVNAITGAVEQAFSTIWLLGAKASANTLTGPAANGGVVPGLASTTSGKIV